MSTVDSQKWTRCSLAPIRRGITHILDHPSRVAPVFQPIVRLDSRDVIGFEALARWPESPGVNPVEAFDVARTLGEVARLDWWCRRRAFETAVVDEMDRSQYLFMNVEPDTLASPPPWQDDRLLADVEESGIQIVLELTERTLLSDPSTVLRTVEQSRRSGYGIALDDIGARVDGLALLDVIAPDVVKFDRGLTHMDESTIETALAITIAGEYARRHDVAIIAEGVETSAHERCAEQLGATLGQGFRYGRPGPLSDVAPLVGPRPRLVDTTRGRVDPLRAISDRVPTAVGSLTDVLSMCDAVENAALEETTPGCVVAALQGARHISAEIAARYRDLARRQLLVGLTGPGLGRAPQPGVLGPLTPDTAPDDTFAVAVIAAGHAVAVIATAIDGPGRPGTGDYRWCITTDRTVVAEIARSIIVDLAPR